MDNASKITKLVHDQFNFARDEIKRLLVEGAKMGHFTCDPVELEKITNLVSQSLESSFIKMNGSFERAVRRMVPEDA